MPRSSIVLVASLLLWAGSAAAQYLPSPPPAPAVAVPSPPPGPPPASAVPPPAVAAPEIGREFCDQQVSFHVAGPDSAPPPYREFLGIWSDASWTPQLCAALIVQGVQPDGTASIVYAFGPMNTGARGPGGVLHGTGIIRGGELKFQNNDGSQFSFKPYFADLDGRLTTPKGQTYQAIFKKTY